MVSSCYIFDEITREQLGPFNETELRAIVAALTPAEIPNKKVWITGWENWKTIADYLKPASKPSPSVTVKVGTESDVGAIGSAVNKVDLIQINQRKHTRMAFRIPCTISNDKTEVKTFSKDISLGGIQLEDAIPKEMLSTKCVLKLAEPEGTDTISMTLNLTVRNEPKYFYFSDFAPLDMSKLELWLARLSKVTIKRPKFKS